MAKTFDAKGRSKHEGGYIKTPHYLFDCFAWRQISVNARCAWHEIMRLYNGSNNGTLAASSRWLADRLGVRKTCASEAIRELVTYGFLEIAKGSSFSAKKIASEYRLTHITCDATGTAPSKAFMRLNSPPTRTDG